MGSSASPEDVPDDLVGRESAAGGQQVDRLDARLLGAAAVEHFERLALPFRDPWFAEGIRHHGNRP